MKKIKCRKILKESQFNLAKIKEKLIEWKQEIEIYTKNKRGK